MGADQVAGVILAAGKGTRMKSRLPKVLHSVCGVPMAELVGRALLEAGVERRIMVVGHGGDLLIDALGDSYEYAWQHEQKGTGHAAMMAEKSLKGFDGCVMVTPGDTPLLEGEWLRAMLDEHRLSGADCTVGTAILDDPTGYGRVLRSADGGVERIVEHRDANEVELACPEVNTGFYCFDRKRLFEVLPTLRAENDQGEVYLTDAIERLRKDGCRVNAFVFEDTSVMMGVNDRWQLAEASRILRRRVLKRLAMSGVTIVDPDSTYVSPDVEIGEDTIIEPMTILEGATRIGSGCTIGPATRAVASTIEDGCTVIASQLNKATLLAGARCGPYANLRPGAVIGPGAKIGNFVEVKNASVGEKAAVSHLSYIGDGSVGAAANIGAGTIFCNYDGFNKYRTEVGDGAFVGSNSTLIAPVKIGENAIVGAGSVISKDVPPDALGLGRSHQEVKEEWASKWRAKKLTDKE